MKLLTPVCLIATVMIVSAETEQAPSNPKPKFRDAASHDQLTLKLRKVEEKDPMKEFSQTNGKDPAKVKEPTLLEDSDIICFQGFATLVPKRAILAIPKNFKDRLTIKPGSRIVTWPVFFAANRGWIVNVEVTQAQAEGKVKFTDKVQEGITKSSNLVVATYMGGPISVLPIKEPEAPSKTKPKDIP